jgi:hypothetical protein
MARTTKSGKELSFNTVKRCWCKNYQDEKGKRNTKATSNYPPPQRFSCPA